MTKVRLMENREELKIKKSVYESALFEFWVRERELNFIKKYKDNPKFTIMEDQATIYGPFILFLSIASAFAEEKGFIENNCGKNKFALFSVDNYKEAEDLVNLLKDDEVFKKEYLDKASEVILQSYLDFYKDKEEKSFDLSSLVAQIYFGEPLDEKQIKQIKNIINDTIEKIENGEIKDNNDNWEVEKVADNSQKYTTNIDSNKESVNNWNNSRENNKIANIELLIKELIYQKEYDKSELLEELPNLIINTAKVLAKHFFPKKLRLDWVGLGRFYKFYKIDIGEEFPIKREPFVKLILNCFGNYSQDDLENFCIIDRNLFEKFLWEIASFNLQINTPTYSIFYYYPLYNNYREMLNQAGITNEEMMIDLIKKYFPSLIYRKDYFVFFRGYDRISSSDEIALIENKICSLKYPYLNSIVKVEELVKDNEMQFVPAEVIEKSLKNGIFYIKNRADEYILKDYFNITDEQKERLIETVNWICERYTQASFDKIDVIDELKKENDQFSDIAFRDIIFEILGDNYEKQGQNIVRKGQSEAFSAFLRNYLKDCEHTTLGELQELAKQREGKMETKRILDVVLNVMVRINANDFVADKFLDFDIERTDEILDTIIKEDFIGIKEVSSTQFEILFPPLSKYKWNTFLLESYCRRFSKKYKFYVPTANSKGVGAILKKEIEIKNNDDYYNLMAKSVLINRNVEVAEDDIGNFLVNKAGYIAEVNRKKLVQKVIEAINKIKGE